MSAYVPINRGAGGATGLRVLPSTTWRLNSRRADAPEYLTIHHLTYQTAEGFPGLPDYLHRVFANELERGRTYSQEIIPGEEYSRDQFNTYFFPADVFVAVFGHLSQEGGANPLVGEDGKQVPIGFAEAVNCRTWEDSIAGCYYVKPNYPVPPTQRGHGIGAVLARSYLHYGPRLGYEASVYNLVFVTNVASVRLWEGLNFTKVGLIPRAGRLKKTDGTGEEYVDAWVFL